MDISSVSTDATENLSFFSNGAFGDEDNGVTLPNIQDRRK